MIKLERAYSELVAHNAALEANSSRLESERKQQQHLLQLLESVNHARSVDDIYAAAVKAVVQCLQADRASILLYDEQQVMRFKFARGISKAYQKAVEGHSPWKPDERNAQPVTIESIEKSAIEEPLKATILREGIRAAGFIPLSYDQRLLGKFMVYYNQPHEFTTEELRLAELIAAPVASAVERRQAADALAQAKSQLEEHTLRLEKAVADRTAKLRETVGELEAFCYSLSHDMRAPLRAMRSFSELLRANHSTGLDEQGREMLERIISASGRLDRLIQDVLAYSRITLAPLQREPVDVDKLLEQIIREHAAFQEPLATMQVQVGLPRVLGHEASLTQCIYNLLSNAVKFVVAGQKAIVRIRAEDLGKEVKLWFEDNGIGIPKDAQARMFLMFQRFHGPKQYEGTGIGLAIVARAAQRMGGSCGVESAPNQGSQFWIELPAAG